MNAPLTVEKHYFCPSSLSSFGVSAALDMPEQSKENFNEMSPLTGQFSLPRNAASVFDAKADVDRQISTVSNWDESEVAKRSKGSMQLGAPLILKNRIFAFPLITLPSITI